MLGNSFGSQLAAAVAAGHPEAVDWLVLLSPTTAPAVRRRLAWLRGLPARTAADDRPSGRWRGQLLGRLHARLGGEPPLRALNVAEYGCASLPRAASTLRSAVLEPIEQALPGVAAPALVIRADGDHLSSPDWAGQLASLLPGGRLVRLPGLGHDAFYQDADAVAAAAAPFLTASAGDERRGRRPW